MVEINLIRQRYVLPARRRERFIFLASILLPILLFSGIIIAVIHSVNKTVILNYSARIEKQEATRQEKQGEALAPTEEEKAWQAQLTKIIEFQGRRLLLTPKLVVLSDITPSRFYFTRINFEGGSVLLEGQGLPGNKTISSLVLSLEKLNRNENFIQGLSELKLSEVKEEGGVLSFRASGTKK